MAEELGFSAGKKTSRGHTATSTTLPSATLQPISHTANLVVYQALTGKYTLRFTAGNGLCWLGVHGSGASWLWSATVSASAPATYSASGTVSVRIGAPSALSGITLDGKPVQLPSGDLWYDAEFRAG